MKETSFYGMAFNPFDKQMLKEKDCFHSNDFDQMLFRLNYLKDVRGIGVFTANPGMGKTFALRCFASELNKNLYHMEYICLSTVSVTEFYKQFCNVLGVSESGRKSTMFKEIQDRILYLYRDRHQPLILAVDEAQFLNTDIFNDIRMLMNYGYDSLNCFTLILCGESYLKEILSKSVHEALCQRITVHYNFTGLKDQEVADYVFHKIHISGASESIISEAALSAVHSYSQGNPRLIDNLMTDAITIGYQAGKEVIDSDIIMSAIENQKLI